MNIGVKSWWTGNDDEISENVVCLMIIDSWKQLLTIDLLYDNDQFLADRLIDDEICLTVCYRWTKGRQGRLFKMNL